MCINTHSYTLNSVPEQPGGGLIHTRGYSDHRFFDFTFQACVVQLIIEVTKSVFNIILTSS